MQHRAIAMKCFRSSLCALAACFFAGCSSAPEPTDPLIPPPLTLGVGHWTGTVLTGRHPARSVAAKLDPNECLAVTAELFYVDGPTAAELAPIASRTRLVVGASGGEPLLPVAELTVGAQVGSGSIASAVLEATRELADDVSRARLLDRVNGALPAGVTLSIDLEADDPIVADDGETVRRRFSILISRDAADAVTIAIRIDDVAPDAIFTDDETPANDVVKTQIVVLEDAPEIDGAPLLLEVPSRFDPRGMRTFVASVELRSAPQDDDAHARVVARCSADLEAAARAAAMHTAAVGSDEVERRALAAGLVALEDPRDRRAALVFLSGSSDAPLALDLALTADDPAVADWITTMVIVGGELPDTEGVGWLLERSAFALLAARLDSGELDTLLRGLLAQHAGEAGRFPGTISGALARASTRDEFETALVAENFDFLSTSDPAARVRAFDWLAARNAAPAGYDPLGTRDARREALAEADKVDATSDAESSR